MARRNPAAARRARRAHALNPALPAIPVSFDVSAKPATTTTRRTPAIGGRAERLEGRRLMSTVTWDGGSVTDSNWSTPENWVGDVAPQPGDDLVFAANGDRPANVNDFTPGTSFKSITLFGRSGEGYALTGNSIELTEGLTFDSTGATASGAPGFGLPTVLAGAATFASVGSAISYGALNVSSNINNDGYTLTLDAAGNNKIALTGQVGGFGAITRTGTGEVSLAGASNYSGGTNVDDGPLYATTAAPNSATGPGAVAVAADGELRGAGRVAGAVTVNGTIAPGGTIGGSPSAAGTLRTGSLTIGNAGEYVVDLSGPNGGPSDAIAVSGSVTLDGTLTLDVDPLVSADQTFTIIDNDGVDPVIGTFDGLIDEDILDVGSRRFQINYNGGDGNDVVLKILPNVPRWDGGGGDNNLTTAANWLGDVVPNPGDVLVFEGSLRKSPVNDFPADTRFGGMTFIGSGFNLTGNPIGLASNIVFDHTNGTTTIGLGMSLTTDVIYYFRGDSMARLVHSGALNLNDKALTVSVAGIDESAVFSGVVSGTGGRIDKIGNGKLTLTGNNTYTGDTDVATGAGTLFANDGGGGGTQTGAGALTFGVNAELRGNGRVGDVSGDGNVLPGPTVGSIGTLRTGSLNLSTLSTVSLGLASAASHDQLDVTGTVTLDSTELQISLDPSFTLPLGQLITLIANDGSDPVTGTFEGIEHGGQVPGQPSGLRVFYNVGDGNDVVVRNVGTTRTWDGGGADDNWSTRENWADDVAPVNGEAIVLAGSTRMTPFADVPFSARFKSLTFTDAGFTLGGNPLEFEDGITTAHAAGTSTITGSLVVAGDTTFTVDGGNGSTGSLVVSGNISISTTDTLTLNAAQAGASVTLGQVGSGNASVVKAGPGSASITGAGTYAGGTTVNGGTLAVADAGNAIGTGSGAVTIANGGAIRGSGRIGALDFDNGSAFAPVLSGVNPSDQLVVTGAVSLTGATLEVEPVGGFSIDPGGSLVLIANDGSDNVIGTFDGLEGGASIPGLAASYQIRYDGGDGNDVAIVRAQPPAAGEIGFSAGEIAVDEDAGQLLLSVLRTGGSSGAVTVDYAFAAGTASGVDFTGTNGTLTFADGETSKQIAIPIANDTDDEDAETFTVTLGNFTGGAAAGTQAETVVTIADDDEVAVLGFSQTNYTVDENAGSLTATINRIGGSSNTVTVRFRTERSTILIGNLPPTNANPGTDYTEVTETVTFGPGETSKTVAVPILDDARDNAGLRFLLTLDQPGAGAALGDVDLALVTIVDDDANQAPVAVDDIATGVVGGVANIDVLANDSDAEGDALTVSVATQPAHGTVQLVNNRIDYTVADGFSGVDTFTYLLTDSEGNTDTGAVTVVTAGTTTVTDPTDPTKTVLVTGGSAGADKITFSVKRGGQVQVMVNGKSQGAFDAADRVVVGTGSGNDKITVSKLKVPVQLDGGDGDDTLTGTKFNDVLVGGPGNDRISGGGGRDLLIGSEGADRLAGGAGDDILIAGPTGYSPDTESGRQALQALLTAWSSADSYDARVAQLAAGVGSGNTIKLDAAYVDHDDARDQLAGDAGRDLFFAILSGELNPDVTKGRKSDETVVG